MWRNNKISKGEISGDFSGIDIKMSQLSHETSQNVHLTIHHKIAIMQPVLSDLCFATKLLKTSMFPQSLCASTPQNTAATLRNAGIHHLYI